MSIATTTHLNFRGTARAALEHYRSVFGGDLAVVTYEQAAR
jgi:PhnB protein